MTGHRYHLLVCAAASLVPLAVLQAQTTRIELPHDHVPGYARTVTGEELRYQSPLPWIDRSLLVRSLSRDRFIKWQTMPVPETFDRDTAVFVIMAGIDVHESPRQFDLFLDGELTLSFWNPRAAAAGDTIVWTGDRGVRAEFRVTLIDKYGDAMGYIFLSVPRPLWEESRAVRLKVAGESAGERTWFMIFKEPIAPHIRMHNAPALLRAEAGNRQTVRVELLYLGEAGRLRMTSPIGRIDTALVLGHNRFQIPVPEVARQTPVDLELHVDDYRTRASFTVEPVRRLDLYLIHHTHLDIGYTHHQDEVERLQWQHLEDALRYGAASESYPEEARFVWNPEGLWAVESYLERHGTAEQERLLDGIRRGWIALDGMFANLLTGIASSEGLMRSLETAQRLSERSGVPIESAMLSDIPGFTWGLVPVLAQHGVRYLSIGPNFGHRIGSFLDTWGDRPFYWESPSGRERVLTWVSGAGYAWFHTGLGYAKITKILDEESVFKYLDQLAESGYPYEIAHMRYNIGSDNGPPDPTLADAVRDWNEKYVAPHLIVATTAELFRAFEARYGDELPVYRGDMTGYWEDGAASSARETALARRTAESLVQTEILAAMLGTALPREAVYRAWRNVLLFYEHTWGSWNSISEPESEFTIQQWQRKKEFADSAAAQADRLRRLAFAGRADTLATSSFVDVFNTSNWPRTDVVLLSDEQRGGANRILDDAGHPVPSQLLNSGVLAFRADDVPAFGSKRYALDKGTAIEWPHVTESGACVIANRNIRIEIDTLRGTIRSLTYEPAGREFVASGAGLNQYIYVAGRSPTDTMTSGPVEVKVKEQGPLVWAIETKATAPGSDAGISSEIRLYEGIERIDIINRLDKALVTTPEAVLYSFPFNIGQPEVRIDVPWGSYRPEQDQLPGSSKNYFSLQRWVDIHDREVGVTFVSVDVPMIQLGELATDAIVSGWKDRVEPSATLLSYVMNNYWETNYRAGQEGAHEFRYSLKPHPAFDESQAERFAVGIAQPLIALPVRREVPRAQLPFELEARQTVVTLLEPSRDGQALLVRLYNPGERSDRVAFRWRDDRQGTLYRSDPWERVLEPLPGEFELGPYEILTLRVTR